MIYRSIYSYLYKYIYVVTGYGLCYYLCYLKRINVRHLNLKGLNSDSSLQKSFKKYLKVTKGIKKH